jgi:hypothetical protein
MAQIAKDIYSSYVQGINSFRLRVIRLFLSTLDIVVLYISTTLIDFIELEPKRDLKRLKNQINNQIQAICYGFKTWSFMCYFI